MKETYYYDEEKCAYVKEEKNAKYYLKLFLQWGAWILGISCVIIAATLYFFDGPSVRRLQNQKIVLTRASLEFEKEINRMRLRLDSLKSQDTNLYRLILNAEPIAEKIDTQAMAQAPLDTMSMDAIMDKIKKMDKMLDQTQHIQASLMGYNEQQ
jgi:hypothetical protein